MPSASAIRSRIGGMCGASRGRSAITVASTFPTSNPASRTSASARASRSRLLAPSTAHPPAGKCCPMSPSPAAPRSASMIACSSTSASLCPASPVSPASSTPPRMSGRPLRSGGCRNRCRRACSAAGARTPKPTAPPPPPGPSAVVTFTFSVTPRTGALAPPAPPPSPRRPSPQPPPPGGRASAGRIETPAASAPPRAGCGPACGRRYRSHEPPEWRGSTTGQRRERQVRQTSGRSRAMRYRWLYRRSSLAHSPSSQQVAVAATTAAAPKAARTSAATSRSWRSGVARSRSRSRP